jgi:hypothetical protein
MFASKRYLPVGPVLLYLDGGYVSAWPPHPCNPAACNVGDLLVRNSPLLAYQLMHHSIVLRLSNHNTSILCPPVFDEFGYQLRLLFLPVSDSVFFQSDISITPTSPSQTTMAALLVILGGTLLLIAGTVLQSGFLLLRNYIVARKIGVPIRIILFDHVNPLWLVLDRRVLSLVKRLPFGLGNNSFTRYNYRGWEVPDRYYSHHEMGDAYILVSSRNIWLYIADPEAVMDLWRRGKEFPRDVSVTGKQFIIESLPS